MNTNYNYNGIGILDFFLIVNVIFKLLGIINWNWGIVLWPLWTILIIFIIVFIILNKNYIKRKDDNK